MRHSADVSLPDGIVLQPGDVAIFHDDGTEEIINRRHVEQANPHQASTAAKSDT
jgi:hypothetical protein